MCGNSKMEKSKKQTSKNPIITHLKTKLETISFYFNHILLLIMLSQALD